MYSTLSSFFRESPPVDVYDTEEGRVVEMELAGMKPEDVQVNVEGSLLIVQTKPPNKENRKYLHRERPEYSFSDRRIRLPSSVDTEAVEASMSEGVLVIKLPFRSRASPIQIKVNA